MTDKPGDGPKRTFTEEFEVASSQLIDRIKDLYAEGSVRRVRIKSHDGGLLLELPLNIGAIAGGAVTLAAPWLALLAAFAALVARVRVEVIREIPGTTVDGDTEDRD